MDYRLPMMEFCIGEWMVQLCGDRSLVKSQISLKSMMKTFENEDQGVLVEFNELGLEEVDKTIVERDGQEQFSNFPREI